MSEMSPAKQQEHDMKTNKNSRENTAKGGHALVVKDYEGFSSVRANGWAVAVVCKDEVLVHGDMMAAYGDKLRAMFPGRGMTDFCMT